MKPSDIRFSQDSVAPTFSDGRSLISTLEELLAKTITPETIEYITILWHYTHYYALTGNRRLFLYKRLEVKGLLDDIPVVIVTNYYSTQMQFSRRFTTKNGGQSIRVRRNPGLHYAVDDLIDRQCRANRKTRESEGSITEGQKTAVNYVATGNCIKYSRTRSSGIFIRKNYNYVII